MIKTVDRGSLAALIAGALLPLSFSPFHYYPIAVFSLVALFFLWNDVSPKQAAFRGFMFGLGFFGVGISWIYVAIHDFGQAGWPLAGLMTFAFVSFLSLYIAVLGWLIKKVSRKHFSHYDILLLLPVMWIGFEWFKSWFLTGLPWLELGAGQIDGPLSGYTPIIGVLGVSFLIALSASLLLITWQKKSVLTLIAIAVIWAGGQGLKQQQWTQAEGDELQVTIIQGNVPQAMKWDPEQLFKTLALYEAKTQENWQSDLIVWPENAVTVFHHQAKELFFDPLAKSARENNTDILLGLPVLDGENNQYYNSMLLLGEQEGFYHKNHLVPFGDYVPFEWLRGLIAFFDLPMSAFRPGPISAELLRVADQPVGISICYEDIFSTEILRSLPEARFLVNATNNAWYGDSFAPHQHLQMSQNRSLETGRESVRATTNGISAFIDHQGNISSQTEQFELAVLTAMVQPRIGSTPYVSWGRWPLCLLSLFMLLLWAYYRQLNVNNRQAD
ncbi:MAG: apolipoprotein N-acyltransferase [Gammaproteobacteria bacterium]|nr:MAG: apolipoprotein N-acyltransferase [Gammaproteobacteria bacterium]